MLCLGSDKLPDEVTQNFANLKVPDPKKEHDVHKC